MKAIIMLDVGHKARGELGDYSVSIIPYFQAGVIIAPPARACPNHDGGRYQLMPLW
jgi:hypothetical protein